LLHHVSLPVRDLEISEAFYTKTYWISGAVHEISGRGFKTSLSVQEASI
jgi:catechol 2,3-dioxygenase-like lactoylglutathione lyase family enzyme